MLYALEGESESDVADSDPPGNDRAGIQIFLAQLPRRTFVKNAVIRKAPSKIPATASAPMSRM